MATKRRKARAGLFERERITVTAPFTAEDFQTFSGMLEAATPRGRVATWRPHAERLGVAVDLLDQAASLIDDKGDTGDRFWQFDALVTQAVAHIVEAQNVASNVYGHAADGAKYVKRQRDTGMRRWESEQAQHDQWRAWQRDMNSQRPLTRRWSKNQQAKELKRLHSIEASIGTIRKQLEPRPKK